MEIKEIMEKRFGEQKDIIENLTRQIAELQFSIEAMKKNQESLGVRESAQREDDESMQIVESSVGVEEEKDLVNMTEVFEICFSNFSDSNKGLALKTMKMWFQNIVNNPEDKQKSRINITNPQYKNYFAENPGAGELFEVVGFKLRGNFLEYEAKNQDRLKEMLDKITEGISSLPVHTFSNSAPWQRAKSLIEKKDEEPTAKPSEEKKEESKEEKPLITLDTSKNKPEDEVPVLTASRTSD